MKLLTQRFFLILGSLKAVLISKQIGFLKTVQRGSGGMRLDKFKTVLKKALKELEKLKIIGKSNINKKGIVTYIRL